MAPRLSDFPAFLTAMHAKSLLHLGHRNADCDALGSAYAMSRVLPGVVGFAGGVNTAAQDLANWLGLKYELDPKPQDYDYLLLYDIIGPKMVGMPLPSAFALFDHHEPGGHRFANFESALSTEAEWAWVQPVESTCSLLVDLFLRYAIPLDQKMAVALAAGIITDTRYLYKADSQAMQRMEFVLRSADMYMEDILAIIESPASRAIRRSGAIQSMRDLRERAENGWSIVYASAETRDQGIVVIDVMEKIGSDVGVVSLSMQDCSMVMAECSGDFVTRTNIDLKGVMQQVSIRIGASETWGTRSVGRIVAAFPEEDLLCLCVDAISGVLSGL
jgi:nanoRNase/pAp phosphatase (c-di-AMP/oligoRNAs hydrolase)